MQPLQLVGGASAFRKHALGDSFCQQLQIVLRSLPAKPVAHEYGLLSIIIGLLYGIVAYSFGLLGFLGRTQICYKHYLQGH